MADLSSYIGNSVLKGTQDLFNSLDIRLNTPTDTPLPLAEVLSEAPKAVTEMLDKVKEAYFVGTIDDHTLQGRDEALSLEDEISGIDEHYKGMMVFAVDIAEGEKVTRSEITALNRALNRKSKAAPVALMVRYGEFISFSICERTAYLQSGHRGEKPGKVSLLRDISYEKPHRGHLDILEDMRAVGIKSFDVLYHKWLKVFNNDTLTDRFYVELQNWFFWAIKVVSFPNDIDDETDDEKYNPENIIRLITRLIFVWFLMQKGLVPRQIFKKDRLSNILKDFDPESGESSQYYRAILQNLFFATLNKPIEERYFAFDKGWLKNRPTKSISNLYRFEQDFVWWKPEDPEASFEIVQQHVVELFAHVPYMNNSLFECLDDKKRKGKTYYWDGFSRNPKRRAHVPNKLFFTEEEIVDLTDSYLDLSEKQTESDLRKYRSVSVHGLIDILSRYHFTIEENTPIDIDVALDPELLGKVFEKLLAAFNPETKKTARKSTGSYYTPRPIVQYMVDESIVVYLQRTVPSVSEETLRLLLSFGKDVNIDLSDKQRKAIVEAVFKCRMLDPACGSGAFPMGILQQLSHLLSRVDVDNRYWADVVMNRALFDVQKAAHLNEEAQAKEKAEIQAVFNMSVAYPDYARKLYLIENCIYGVDIQCIAVQISRLRFFISLLCEQQPTEDAADNFGVRPLPNLEMKFVTANTLVKPANVEETQLLLEDKEIQNLISELRQVRHQMFVATSATSRKHYRERDERLREQIAQLSANNFADKRQQDIEYHEKLLAEAESEMQFAKDNLPDTAEIIEETDLFGNVISIRKESIRDRKLKEISGRVNNIKSALKKLRETAESGRVSTLALARQLTDWNPYDQNVSSSFFDPDWMFGIKDGFDIVIGNPPYVQLQANGGLLGKLYENSGFETFTRMGDIYSLFYERGWSLLKPQGILCFITSNKWMRAGYGEKTRNFFATKTNPLLLIDFASTKVFDSATVDTNILLFSRENNTGETFCCIVDSIDNMSDYVKHRATLSRFSNSESWVILSSIEQSIKQKIEAMGVPLKDWDIQINYGIKTGCNEAFIVNTETRDRILNVCADDAERKRTENLIRPILRGRDIKRYGYKWADLWLINTHNGIKGEIERVHIEDYPAVKAHLDKYLDIISTRSDKGDTPYNLRHCAYMDLFDEPKICWKAVGRNLAFAIVPTGIFLTAPASFISAGKYSNYLLAVLLSRYGHYYINKFSDSTGAGDLMLNIQSLIQLPIKVPTETELENIEKLLLEEKYDSIDKIIYESFEFNEVEIEFIAAL